MRAFTGSALTFSRFRKIICLTFRGGWPGRWPFSSGAGWVICFGLPCLRLRGDYLAIVTLGFAEAFRELMRNLDATGSDKGIIFHRSRIGFPWLCRDCAPGQVGFIITALVLFLAVFLIQRLYHSQVGRAWIAIRENEVAAASVGVPVVQMKLLAFSLSAAIAAVAGVIYAALDGYISPDIATFQQSIMVLAMVILGGLGNTYGALLGAALLYLVPEYLKLLPSTIQDTAMVERDHAALPERRFPASFGLPLDSFWRGDGDHDAVPAAGAAGEQPAQNGDSAPMTPLLETRELSKTFGGLKAVQGINLHIGANRIVSVIGPNGAGKTTFFNCLSGIYRPDGGSIFLDGRDITGRAPHQVCRLGLSRTFQNIRLFPEMTVLENVLVAQFQRRSHAPLPLLFRTKHFCGQEEKSREEAMGFLDFVGLAARAEDVSGSLAYGLQTTGWKSPARWRRSRGCFCSMNRRRG